MQPPVFLFHSNFRGGDAAAVSRGVRSRCCSPAALAKAMAAIHPPRGVRPSSARARSSSAADPYRTAARPHSARAAVEQPATRSSYLHSAQATTAGHLRPHPPAQQPPDAVVRSGARPTSAHAVRYAYQQKIDRERETARQLRLEREDEKGREEARKAAVQRRKAARAQAGGGTADPEPEVRTERSAPEPKDVGDEPTGSFRRRRIAHEAVMRSLKQENPRADSRAAPPAGREWRDLNRGLNNLFRTRPQFATMEFATMVAAQDTQRSVMGYQASSSAAIPSLHQKALQRQVGALKEFYEVGLAGRVLGEVDKSFVKRRANPDGVTKQWAMDVDRKREQMAPWAASNREAVYGRQAESAAQRRDRLRAEMAEKRREREAKLTAEHDEDGDVVQGAFSLRTNEHASLGLQLALQREARDAKKEEKLKGVSRPIGPHVLTDTENRVAACIVPLTLQAQSQSVEVQRDVAAALYSLSIADENKPAFVAAQALETVIAMAQSRDPDVRRNIAGTMYRLSTCGPIKRRFVKVGVLRPLLALAQGSKDREVQRYSMLAIKELCEKRENHVDIIDAHALPILYTNLASTDPRIRKEAIWTLNHLAAEETNRLRMLRDRALDIMLQHLQAQDVVLRRGSASTLVKFSQLLEVAPADIVKELTSKKTLSALIDALTDRDLEVSTELCKALVIMKSARLTKMMLTHKGLAHVLAHASRLLNLDGTGVIHANLTQIMTVLLTFMPAKLPENVMVVMDEGYMSTLLNLCKYNSGKVRRSAGKLLARLSTIEASKEKMMADPETVSLLNSLCKQSDFSSRMTAVKVIAELAEEPKNRLPLYLAAVLPTLFELIRKGDDEMRFQCARAIADMAEAVELRVPIVYAGLEQILQCMLSEVDHVQEHGMRTLVNLAAPAGFACGAVEGEVGRYGALEALKVDDQLDDTSSSSDDSGDSDSDDSDDSDDSKESDDASDDDGEEDDAMDAIADMIGASRFLLLE